MQRSGSAGTTAHDGFADAGTGGMEATRRIRAAFPDAQIIIVTQYDDQHWRTAPMEAGSCGYLLKENLLELRQMLKKSPPVTN